MNASQISALSQIQAQAIVNARPQTAIVGGGKPDEKPTAQQIQNQIQLQAQALVHAHTQAQISAGIYKGGEADAAAPVAAPGAKAAPQAPLPQPQTSASLPPAKMPPQPAPNTQQPAPAVAQPKSNPPATGAPTTLMPPIAAPSQSQPPTYMPSSSIATPGINPALIDDGHPLMPANSPEFLAKLNECLTGFWAGQLEEMRALGTDPSKAQSEQDFKNHNDLPLARIKRIMKSDEDVRMISAEAPVLFAKACEMFINEMTLRSWNYSENNKRKTLQREDVKEAIQRTDILDFLVDVIH